MISSLLGQFTSGQPLALTFLELQKCLTQLIACSSFTHFLPLSLGHCTVLVSLLPHRQLCLSLISQFSLFFPTSGPQKTPHLRPWASSLLHGLTPLGLTFHCVTYISNSGFSFESRLVYLILHLRCLLGNGIDISNSMSVGSWCFPDNLLHLQLDPLS